jgi:protein SCO1/2
MKNAKSLMLSGLLGSVIGLFSLTAMAADPEYHGLRVEPPKSIHPSILITQNGESATFPFASGKWQMVFFGYTHCPDVCPVTMQKASKLLQKLGDDAGRLQVVFVSIDAGRDRPEILKSFLAPHDPRITGLTGDPEAMQMLANEFGVLTRRFQGKTALAYTLEHSSFLYLLDPRGRVSLLYPATSEIAGMADDLRRLIAAPQEGQAGLNGS